MAFSYITGMLIIGLQLLFITVCGVVELQSQSVVHHTDFVNLRNVGIILQPVKSMAVIADTWRHTFAINLSSISRAVVRPQQPCSTLQNPTLVETCQRSFPLLHSLQLLDRKTVSRLNQSITHVLDLMHDTLYTTASERSKRAWLPFVSDIAKTVFGFAKASDLESVQAQIVALRKQNAGALDTMAVHAERLTSYVALSNQRFDKFQDILQTQQEEFRSFFASYKTDFHDAQTAQLLVANTLQRVVDFATNLQQIATFEQAVLLASHGMLTPELIPIRDLQETFVGLQQVLAQIHSPFYIMRQRPEDVYGSKDFHIWMEDNVLHITVLFHLSPMAHNLRLFSVHAPNIPYPAQVEHYTRAINLPKAIAFDDDEDLFLVFKDEIPQIPESGLFFLQNSQHGMMNKSIDSCLSAIVTKSANKITRLCQFALQPNSKEPQIFRVGPDSLLLIHVPSYTLQCSNGSQTYTPEPFVEVTLPCSCSFHSIAGNHPGQTFQCQRDQTFQPSYVFGTNLQALSAYFSDDDLSTISATSALNQPLKVTLPNITVLEHHLADTMSSLRQDSLALKQVANSTQEEARIFRSSTDRLLYDLTNSDLPFESPALSIWSWQTILLIPTTVACLITGFAVYVLFGKFHTLTLAINVMSHLPLTNAQPVTQASLNYFRSLSSTTTRAPFPLPQVDFRLPALDVLLMFIIVTTLIVLGILWYRHRIGIQDTFQLLIEVGSPHQRALLNLLTLPHTPHMYQITITAPIELMSITGWLLPELQLNWSGVTVFNRHSNVYYPLPHTVRISFATAYKLRQLLQQPYYVLLFNFHDQRLAPLKMPKEFNCVARPTKISLYPHHMLPPYLQSSPKAMNASAPSETASTTMV